MIIISIDGPAAAGKGFIAKSLATKFGYLYFNTGNIYRYLAYRTIQHQASFKSTTDLLALIDEIFYRDIASAITYLEHDHDEIHTSEVSKAASIIAAQNEVRLALVEVQRFVPHFYEQEKMKKKDDPKKQQYGAVIDGRDIGTTIFPEAQCKFFITASAKIRAERRLNQLQSRNEEGIYGNVLADIIERDLRDSSRSLSPMSIAHDAFIIDSSTFNKEEITNFVVRLAEAVIANA